MNFTFTHELRQELSLLVGYGDVVEKCSEGSHVKHFDSFVVLALVCRVIWTLGYDMYKVKWR